MTDTPVTNEILLAELRNLRHDLRQLDNTIRGNNGEGLITRAARIEERTIANSASIGRAFTQLEELETKQALSATHIRAIENRLSFAAGWVACAALGGGIVGTLLGVVAKNLLARLG